MDPSEIRQPDSVTNEQLIADNRSEFDKQMEEALQLSLEESIIQNTQFEESIIKEYLSQTIDRKEKFTDLLFSMNKVSKFDKDIKDIYTIIYPIVEAYCNQFIQHYEVDEFTYERIFQVLGTIRTNKNTIELLKTIITKSE